MKTRIFAAVLAVLLIVSFCGCDKIFTDYSTSKAGQTESEPDFELNIDRKPDRITILSAFEGGKAGEIVSFLLITLNTDAKTVAVLQIPADTYYSGQVTLADEYRNGLAKEIAQGTQNPVANAMKSVSDLISDSLAVHIDYTAHMTKDQLANVIDTVGGVTLDIPYSIGLDDGSIIKSGRTLLGGSFAAGLVSYNRFSDSFMSELHIHKLLRTNTALFGHQPLQAALRRKAAQKRQHIRLCVELKALVRLFIHMDSQIRNHQQILLNIQQPRLQPALHAAQHASGQRQRPVQPRIQQHTAILFYIQLHVLFVHHDFRVMLQLKRRRIAVAGINLKAEILRLRQHKGQQRRTITTDVIFSASLQLPFFAFLQLSKASRRQTLLNILHSEKAIRRLIQKGT